MMAWRYFTCAMALLGSALLPGAAGAQASRDLVGSWTLNSAVSIAADGTRSDSFGPNPKGLYVFESNSRFALINVRADLPKFASGNRNQGTPEENQAIVQGGLALFGSYAVVDKVLTLKVEAGTWPNWSGTDLKVAITSYTGDEVKGTLPTDGGTTEITLRRIARDGTVAAGASTTQAPPSLPAPTPVHLNRFVPTGEERMVAFYPTLFIDCSSRGPTVGRITTKPQHGTIGLNQGESFAFYNPNSSLSACNNKKVPGLLISYKSEDGYIGEDTVGLLVIFADGSATQLDVLFLVR
jgi:hypothetical protein